MATQAIQKITEDGIPLPEKLTPLNEEWGAGKTIGQGQFGTVYHAYGSNGNHAAAKVYHGHLTSTSIFDAESVFRAEKDALSHIKHPRIVRIYDSFTIPDPIDREANRPVIITDYIPGSTLEQVINRGEPFSEARAASKTCRRSCLYASKTRNCT